MWYWYYVVLALCGTGTMWYWPFVILVVQGSAIGLAHLVFVSPVKDGTIKYYFSLSFSFS